MGNGCVEKWDGDGGEKRREDSGTHFYHLFNFSSYFAKFSSVDRNCVVPRLLSSSFVQCKAKVLGFNRV